MEENKSEDKKIVLNSDAKKEVIDLTKFNCLESEAQEELLRTTLDKIYNGDVKITNRHIMKCIKLTWSPYDDETYLPYKLKVEKRDNKLIFMFTKKSNLPIILFFIAGIVFASIGATFSTITILSRAELNKDIDGDGIADINLDLNGDDIAEINVDVDKDDKPDENIDYKGNKMAIFNVVLEDGKMSNKLNQDLDGDGKCDLNCDLDGDGWPDINIDYYGEGKATLDIDTNGDRIPDLNIDTDGDHTCNVMCDTDNDGKCDTACISIPADVVQSGTSVEQGGNPNVNTNTTSIVLIYNSGEPITADGLYPDDQPDGLYKPIKEKIITIENTSSLPAMYSLKWVVEQNTFTSQNFKYKVVGTNGGANIDYTTVPHSDFYFVKNVKIPAKTVQKYTITLKLQGTNAPQNYDQNRIFKAYISATVEDN